MYELNYIGVFMEKIEHFGDIIRHLSKNEKKVNALNNYHNGEWDHIPTDYFLGYVRCIALALRDKGLKRGERVAILAEPSSWWTIVDFAIIIAGGITVPFYSTLSEESFTFGIKDSDPKFIFVGGEEHWNLLGPHVDHFEEVFSINLNADPRAPTCFKDLYELGQEVGKKEPKLYEEMLQEIDKDALATIIYTSGTSGTPRGVMMTQANLCYLINLRDFSWDSDKDRYLSILPLAHIFGRQLNIIIVAYGIPVYYLNDPSQMADVCKEVHPTVMIVVPRVLEKVYANFVSVLQSAGYFTKAFGLWAFDLAKQKDNFLKTLFYPLADKFAYRLIRDVFGGRMRLVISGGAALEKDLNRLFTNVGIPICEGWGLSEASTCVVNRLGQQKVGTVGPPLGDTEIKINEEGRVLVKGPTVMQGFYENKEATEEAFTEDGWLKTGDKGEIDDEGYLKILGRINEMFKTSGGEYISPLPIESELNQAPIVDMSVIIGEKRPYTVALIFPDQAVLRKLKKIHNKTDLSDEEFVETRFVKDQMKELINEVNRKINSWEQIRDFAFIFEPLTIEGGELTPTMKIKRDVVKKKYKDLIAKLYQEAA